MNTEIIVVVEPFNQVNLYQMLDDVRNDYIDRALAFTGGNKARAAALLGMQRTRLVEIQRKRGLLKTKSKAVV